MTDAWDGRPPGGAADQSAHRLLAAPTEGGRVEFSAIWDGGCWWSSPGAPVRPAEAAKWDWRYLGPCLTPDEVAAREAAARRAALEEAARVAEGDKFAKTPKHIAAAIRALAGEAGDAA